MPSASLTLRIANELAERIDAHYGFRHDKALSLVMSAP